MIHYQQISGYSREFVERKQGAWLMRKNGMKYREIAAVLGVGVPRARSLVVSAERRMVEAAAVQLPKPVLDPIVYGMWHEFTHDGRVDVDGRTGVRW